jgi:hypothetical protein
MLLGRGLDFTVTNIERPPGEQPIMHVDAQPKPDLGPPIPAAMPDLEAEAKYVTPPVPPIEELRALSQQMVEAYTPPTGHEAFAEYGFTGYSEINGFLRHPNFDMVDKMRAKVEAWIPEMDKDWSDKPMTLNRIWHDGYSMLGGDPSALEDHIVKRS